MTGQTVFLMVHTSPVVRVTTGINLMLSGRTTRARLLRLRANGRRRAITAVGGPRWWA